MPQCSSARNVTADIPATCLIGQRTRRSDRHTRPQRESGARRYPSLTTARLRHWQAGDGALPGVRCRGICENFLCGFFQGRSPAAPARRGPSPRRDPRADDAKYRRRKREEVRASPPGPGPQRGMGGGLHAPGASAEPRPLARGRCRARRPTPGGCPRFPQAGGCSPSRRSPAPRIADQCG